MRGGILLVSPAARRPWSWSSPGTRTPWPWTTPACRMPPTSRAGC